MNYTLTPLSSAAAQATLDQLWTASQDADDRAFRPRSGWWPLSRWAARSALLLADGVAVGGLAINTARDGALEVRLALLPVHRTPDAAHLLIRAAREQAQRAGVPLLRLTLPAGATWAREAAAAAGLTVARSTLVMLRPAARASLLAPDVPGVTIRPLAPGEEGRLLHGQHLPPVALGAVASALVPAAADLRLDHHIGASALPEFAKPPRSILTWRPRGAILWPG